MTGGIHAQTHRESRLTTEERVEVFSLWSDLGFYEEDSPLLRIMVGRQLQHAEIRELEDPSTKPLPSNGHLHGASLAALFWPSGVMLHVTCGYMVL